MTPDSRPAWVVGLGLVTAIVVHDLAQLLSGCPSEMFVITVLSGSAGHR